MGHIIFYLSFCWTKISNRLTEMKIWITLFFLSGQGSNGLCNRNENIEVRVHAMLPQAKPEGRGLNKWGWLEIFPELINRGGSLKRHGKNMQFWKKLGGCLKSHGKICSFGKNWVGPWKDMEKNAILEKICMVGTKS